MRRKISRRLGSTTSHLSSNSYEETGEQQTSLDMQLNKQKRKFTLPNSPNKIKVDLNAHHDVILDMVDTDFL